MHLRRWLFLTHRWLGIGVCAFFALWFVSGVVMMYVGYPKLTAAERLHHLPPLGTGSGWLTPRQALDAAQLNGPLRELRLAMARGGQPVYLAQPQAGAAGATVVIDARTGQRLQGVDTALALASAAAYGQSLAQQAAPRHLGTVQEDAFTHSRALDAHRPLHRVQLHDAQHTLLYVSSLTGEVVRDAPRNERVWNYAGAWLHWLYMFRGNAFDAAWADIVNWLSIVGIAVAVTGTVVGVMRWRFGSRRYRSGARTPYAGRMMRWHHISGLLFAAITFTWILSGLASMNPWRVFDTGAAPLRSAALQGVALDPGAEAASPQALLASAGPATRELRWVPVLGTLTVQAQGPAGRPLVLDGRSAQPLAVDEAALRQAGAGLLDAPLARIEKLQAHDFHYYERAPHTMTGGGERPLPVLRLVFEDPARSWVHLDPHTGTVLGRSDRGRRASRVLFALLHSWDWLPLLRLRPLWDVLLIGLSLGGAMLSLTGVVIGWRRLGQHLRGRVAARRHAGAAGPPRG
ncbi:PepSY domain-containing protein [Xenophilus arseniciresistens]|uniref:PepSY domain-containing protein n=1 Tax=Xenophilus arseniciresistens TaxID=1283306 RepID=A0AAE3SZQ7_9BURK|nr:PepSY domain-containing protein [Xenophilus arseniciresistens]MDA7417379.1 PepSY domain-containing protein [Xenophilus arseniciresistens]